ncbi:MAG: DMT family transporter [Thermoplasmata archaeon]|nr:DMT family transporter [Thermoplasmata archaeon]
MAVSRLALVASIAALLAAVLWASYYFFVLAVTPRVAPAALIVWPFLFGGAAYTALTVAQGHGRVWLRLFTDWEAWARVGLILAMQLGVLASTYLAGAIDTSILSLVGDVVLTPLLVMILLREGREKSRSPAFLLGVSLSSVGAILTIVAGGSPRPLTGIAWVVAPLVAIVVAFYFLAAAHASRRLPSSAVVSQSIVGGGLLGLVGALAFPGGAASLAIPSPIDLGLVAALGLTSFFLAEVLYFGAIERAGLILPAMLMASIPIFTVILSVPLLGFRAPILALLGIPIALVGAILALQGVNAPWRSEYRRAAKVAPDPK